jgi:hypothetical protein
MLTPLEIQILHWNNLRICLVQVRELVDMSADNEAYTKEESQQPLQPRTETEKMSKTNDPATNSDGMV